MTCVVAITKSHFNLKRSNEAGSCRVRGTGLDLSAVCFSAPRMPDISDVSTCKQSAGLINNLVKMVTQKKEHRRINVRVLIAS